MCLSFNAVTVLCALLIEAGFGYPASLLDRIKHPVMWMGALIESLDSRLNHPSTQEAKRRRNGWIALLLLLAASVLPAIAVQYIMLHCLPDRACGACLSRQHAHRPEEPL
jgi:adenosylcobinamide-phosphate synthase